MPRKLLSDCYRGWYGWEAQQSGVLRQSNCHLWECRHRMDQEKFRHRTEMVRLEGLQKIEQVHSRKALRTMQDEYSRIRAEQRVLQHHAFGRYDPLHDDTPPPSPPTPTSLLPRRPKTERTGVKPPTPKDQLVKRNSLPSLDLLGTKSAKATPHRKPAGPPPPAVVVGSVNVSRKKVAAAVAAVADSVKTSAHHHTQASGSCVGALPGRRNRGERRGPGSDTKGTFFLTDSQIITSSVLEEEEEEEEKDEEDEVEEEEEEEEDEVFDGPPEQSRNTANSHVASSHVTSDDTAATLGRDGEELKRRKDLRAQGHSFQSIDYILGAQILRAPGTLISSTLPAKPAIPRGTVKSSNTTTTTTTTPTTPFSSLAKDQSSNRGSSSNNPSSLPTKHVSISFMTDVNNSEFSNHWDSRDPKKPVTEQAVHGDAERQSDSGNRASSSLLTAEMADKDQPLVAICSDKEHLQSSSKQHLQSPTREHSSNSSTKEHPHPCPKEQSHSSTREHSQSTTTLHKADSPLHILQPKSTIHDLQAKSTIHDIQAKSTIHDLQAKSTIHHLQAKSTIHDLQAKSTIHDLQAKSSQHRVASGPDEGSPPRLALLSSLLHPPPSQPSQSQAPEDAAPASASRLSSQDATPASAPRLSSQDAAPAPKLSLLSRFRQAAEVIVEEKREERGVGSHLFAALLLNRPQQKLKVRALEKPAGVTEKEEKDLWKALLSNVQHAVRWKAKILRESQGIPTTRQRRRQAREQQEAKERMRRHVFPGHCRTTYAMKKFLTREIDQLVAACRPENRRKRHNKVLKDHACLPEFVDRVRSTTAILRDFRQYLEECQEGGVE